MSQRTRRPSHDLGTPNRHIQDRRICDLNSRVDRRALPPLCPVCFQEDLALRSHTFSLYPFARTLWYCPRRGYACRPSGPSCQLGWAPRNDCRRGDGLAQRWERYRPVEEVMNKAVSGMDTFEAATMSKNGKARVAKNFSRRAMGDRLEEENQDMVGVERPPLIEMH